jgi:hypothetical protein
MRSTSNSPIAARRARRQLDSGWKDLVLTFGEATLPAPPIPKHLRAALVRRRSWCWSTVPVEPMSMYFLEPAVADRHARTTYAAMSHAGHGANSYGLNLYIVDGDIAIFLQHGWGASTAIRLRPMPGSGGHTFF